MQVITLDSAYNAKISSDGKWALAYVTVNEYALIELETSQRFKLQPKRERLNRIQFSPDSSLFAWSESEPKSETAMCTVRNVNSPTEVIGEYQMAYDNGYAFSSDSTKIALSQGKFGRMHVDIVSRLEDAAIQRVEVDVTASQHLLWRNDSLLVADGTSIQQVRTQDSAVLSKIPTQGFLGSFSASLNGRYVAASCGATNPDTGEKTVWISLFDMNKAAAAFARRTTELSAIINDTMSPLDRKLATTNFDLKFGMVNAVAIFDVMLTRADHVYGIAFSPDNRLCAFCFRHTLEVFDCTDGHLVKKIDLLPENTTQTYYYGGEIVFLADGRLAVSTTTKIIFYEV